MRRYSPEVTPKARECLDRLVQRPEPDEYRALMQQLGEELGRLTASRLRGAASLRVVCSNEDADFLAKGVLTALEEQGFSRVALTCFWNERIETSQGDVAPIIRRYVEPSEDVDAMIIVKSIISSSCVVRTHITEMLGAQTPRWIEVVAPVMWTGARERLESEFAPEVAKKFDYVCFAQDDDVKANGEVVPGIGGFVYELLGLGDSSRKNSFTPSLVKTRRPAH